MSSSSAEKVESERTRDTTVDPTQSMTNTKTMNTMPHLKPIITTAEVSVTNKEESTATSTTASVRVTLPAKRGRHFDIPHSLMSFANEEDFQAYVECGKLKNQTVTPCVDRSSLNDYPMVFEEWQVCKSEKYGLNEHSKCVFVVHCRCTFQMYILVHTGVDLHFKCTYWMYKAYTFTNVHSICMNVM